MELECDHRFGSSDPFSIGLARVESRARELGCVAELAQLPELVRRGGGAGAQRATHEIAGMDALVRQLTELTAAGATWSNADRRAEALVHFGDRPL